MLCGFLDSVKQTVSDLANAWHRVVDFKPTTRRFAIGAFDDDMINTSRQALKINMFFNPVDTASMQL